MKGRKLAALFAAASGLLLLSACGKQNSAANKQVLNWSETKQLSTQDPSLTTDTTSFQTELNTGEGLYRLDKHQKPQLALAKKVKVSKDGTTYDFYLRKAKWANGDPLTAKDFVYSWRRTLTPSTKSTMAFYLYYFKNAQQINAGKKAPTTLGAKAIGKYHLQVVLTRPVSYFKRFLAFPLYYPQNEKFVKQAGKKFGTAAKYTLSDGPFKLTKWTGNNKEFSLVKNNNYWDAKKVKLQRVNETISETTTTSYNLYQAGKLDETTLTGEQVAANKHKSGYHTRSLSGNERIDLNLKKVPAYRNVKIRQALSLAINRRSLVNNVLRNGSTAALGFVPSGMGNNPKTGEAFDKEAYVKSAVAYNLPAAKRLLREGFKEAKINHLNITLSTADDDNRKQAAEFLQSKLEQLPGVKVNVQVLPFTTLIARQSKGQFNATLVGWSAILGDPINFLDVFEKDSSYNNAGWVNADYDKALAESEGKYANQPVQRWAKLVQAEKVLMKDQGTIPLYQMAEPQLVKSSVKNISFNPVGIPYDFKEVYLAGN